FTHEFDAGSKCGGIAKVTSGVACFNLRQTAYGLEPGEIADPAFSRRASRECAAPLRANRRAHDQARSCALPRDSRLPLRSYLAARRHSALESRLPPRMQPEAFRRVLPRAACGHAASCPSSLSQLSLP